MKWEHVLLWWSKCNYSCSYFKTQSLEEEVHDNWSCFIAAAVTIMMVAILEDLPLAITLTINEMKLTEYWLGKEALTEGTIPKKGTKFSW
jgi:phenylpyruvate tautomerase PptA (4-oxalocrotonate tautomerase family)